MGSSQIGRILTTAVSIALIPPFLIGAALLADSAAEEKIKVEKLDDLPRQSYEISGTVSELMASEAEFKAFMAQVKADLEGLLDTYAIEDQTTLQRFHGTLRAIAFLEGDYDGYREHLETARSLEEKEATRLTMGLIGSAYIKARQATGGGPEEEAFRTAFRTELAGSLENLPWDLVMDTLEQNKGRMEILSENLILGVVKNQLDPAVEKTGSLSRDQAEQVIGMKNALAIVVPVKDDAAAVFGEAIMAHRVEKKDIWPDRDIALAEGEGKSRVLVAVWDAGTDVDLFPGRLFVNPDEAMDGKDNDGNGYVDDLNGIAYDVDFQRTTDLLHPLGEAMSRRTELEDMMKGFLDVQAAVDSPEAGEIRKKMGNMKQDEVKPFVEDLSLYVMHSHGTHVAGIAVEGNPYADVLVSRLTFDYHMIPKPMTKELCQAFARAVQENVEYFKVHGVRVVNMSWGLALREIESSLELNGVGKDAEERGKMARENLDICRRGLVDAFQSAPEILFVAAAGNEDNDAAFDETVPASLELPNLIVAGAVDQAGEATGFTSFGKTVVVYSNGFEVESLVPGGRRIKASGTSMSSPNVVNLVAKLLAVDPSLEPAEVIQLVVAGADQIGEGKALPVMNPKRSMDLLNRQLAKSED